MTELRYVLENLGINAAVLLTHSILIPAFDLLQLFFLVTLRLGPWNFIHLSLPITSIGITVATAIIWQPKSGSSPIILSSFSPDERHATPIMGGSATRVISI